MAKIKVYNQEAKPLGGANVVVYDSNNKQLGGLVVNNDGEGEVNDSWLVDKDGKIVVSHVSHESVSIPISKFNGNAFLKEEWVSLGNVVITSKPKKKRTPIKITNPYETTVTAKTPPKKVKSPIVPILLGGFGLAALIIVLTTKMNVK
jgi:hypothetical protein